ncbi:phage/plasmid primase, P4 family [Mycobacteroides abscessus]|uniref:phage/plasmid primase, P4 family n=1 Tax=Mycobacteroides abscessus TaxID=36809 RepID=UPI0002684381|nr:phage/plasmid primase, P4 family [Mycobacteroides abscessus]EIV25150.1 phage/plasmid primase, P4 family, C-terminal domain protein [Mycobacteroides abscessus 3A-0119-R]EIV29643.1 phage/plasmid primase, P4 family, C-terminal domain protein [Mycobacteroides abscessus 3A-0122-R]EIV36429.1 phage/plasmid primase, P4 family, C-terminal domain protein [Mycobacteroides abscessus 3A-0122-S]EIV38491.1 phage/plasmid primase, P4 family, C-terminal domain protein [Mycobacteroides abscessus 3A-0731]EIV53
MTETIEFSGQPLTEAHREHLAVRGIPADYLDADSAPLVRSSVLTRDLPEYFRARSDITSPRGLLFGSRHIGSDRVRWRLRLDNPPEGVGKYLSQPAPDAPNHNLITEAGEDAPVWIVEGEQQSHSVAAALGHTATVIGIPGCSGWSTGDWSPALELTAYCDDRDVLIALDADAAVNLSVYLGGEMLKSALSGARSVKFIPCPGGSKTGLDDYLGKLSAEKRASALERLADKATTKPSARRPKAKKGKELPSAEEVAKRRAAAVAAVLTEPDDEDETDAAGFRKVTGSPADSACWFDAESGAFLPESLSRAILDSGTPVAAALDGNLAVYSPKGFYRITPKAFSSKVGRFLGDRFSTNHLANVKERTHGLCEEFDRALPERPTVPLLNVKNGMLDILSGKLYPHDPSYLSTYQIDVAWDPDATCPTYDAWLLDRVGPYQVQVVNEVISQFLDPRRVPSKGLFLFGPNKTGKSTLLRVAKKMAGGDDRVAALTLQQLSGDHFAAAELYGKVINVSADLPKDHVGDLSVFKRVTGGDPLTVNKKYGNVFTFQANSLFLFSANTLPTVDSAEGASYLDRTVPVAFPRKFQPNPQVEETIMEELPGILVKWVQARRAHIERGFEWTPVHSRVHGHFAADSDRVARFVATCCITGVPASTQNKPEVPTTSPPKRTFGPVVTPAALRKWPEDRCPTLSELHEAFETMVGQERGKGMGLSKFKKRLATIPGVSTDKYDVLGRKVVNVLIKPQDDWEPPSDHQSLIPALFPENDVVETPAAVPDTVTPIYRAAAGRRRYWTK